MSKKLEAQAQDALKVIAEAANQATKVIAVAAAAAVDAVKVNNMSSSGDHDLLIKVETKLDSLKEDIRVLNDGTSKTISDHESRIRLIEGRIFTWGGGLLALQFVVGIVLWYFNK